jgi:CRISPR-associated protein Csb2
MATLAIRARFPLGIYLGHQPDGQPSPFPDTARLHAALTHSAGKGSLAQVVGTDLRPSKDALTALRWLELHPPSALTMPWTIPVATGVTGSVTESYRDEGVFETAQRDVPSRRKVRKHQSDAIAMIGPFGWAWDQQAPSDVVDTIAALCEDVSCLGEADTPVILEVGDVEVTHLRDATRTAFPAPGGIGVRTPISGRTDELEADYATARPSKPVKASEDDFAWTKWPASNRPTSHCVQRVIYRPVTPPPPDLPWVAASALPLTREIDPTQRVPWCVALHRALAAYLGDTALPLLTGTYAPGVRPPANRVAIQFVEAAALPGSLGRPEHGAFLILAPAGASVEELALVQRYVAQVSKVYRRGQESIALGPVVQIDVEHFWPEPPEGFVRYWRPVPGMVAETRAQQDGKPWSLEDAALLSIGHVFRDRLSDRVGGPDRYRRIVAQVRDWGVKVHDVRRIPDSRVELFAHKVPSGVVVQPFTARLDLSAILPSTSLLAIGQSRHLGGGLLVPVDESIVAARALPGWTAS